MNKSLIYRSIIDQQMALRQLVDEQAILIRLKNGDETAFTLIYGHYWKKLLLVAWNHSKDKVLAEDIVHEVFMMLWEKRDTLDIGDLAAFLSTAVKFSIFKNYQKERQRQELNRQNYTFSEVSYDEEKLDALFLQEYIDGIVEEMPEKCRLVFRYSREKGLKNSEIAEKLQISEKGVEANLTRALKFIRKGLSDAGLLVAISLELLRNLFFLK